jgi:hypothetical protein
MPYVQVKTSRRYIEYGGKVFVVTYSIIPNGPFSNSSLRQVLTSKFSNPAFHLLIRSMGLSLKIGILSFFEKPLLISG